MNEKCNSRTPWERSEEGMILFPSVQKEWSIFLDWAALDNPVLINATLENALVIQ